VVQRLGKFQAVATAGMNFKFPWLDQVAGRIDRRVQPLALDVDTKKLRRRARRCKGRELPTSAERSSRP
jgi:regulator of protease activity HflC (stomatin/prohibitin superfamily)